jgi:DNA-binding CsgD family transcriptional regulator
MIAVSAAARGPIRRHDEQGRGAMVGDLTPPRREVWVPRQKDGESGHQAANPAVSDDAARPAHEPAWHAPLTPAELQVAALAARGCVNREIAERLFITPSTVEQHLTRVFKKLGITGRDFLPSSLSAGNREDHGARPETRGRDR